MQQPTFFNPNVSAQGTAGAMPPPPPPQYQQDALDPQEGGEGEQTTKEYNIDDYELPPLPEPRIPTQINEKYRAEDVYAIIVNLRRFLDDPQYEPRIASELENDPALCQAMFQILHESGLLLDAEGKPVPLPTAPTPALPPGVRSWLIRKGSKEDEGYQAVQSNFVPVRVGATAGAYGRGVKAEVKAEPQRYH